MFFLFLHMFVDFRVPTTPLLGQIGPIYDRLCVILGSILVEVVEGDPISPSWLQGVH